MYKLTDLLPVVMGVDVADGMEPGLYCQEMTFDNTFEGNRIMGRCACNVLTLVERGWLSLIYDGRELLLTANDFFIYTPGLTTHILSASEDYHALCLLADEDYTIDTPAMRTLVRTAYMPAVGRSEPVFALKADDAAYLAELMRVIIRYIHSDHLFKQETLRHLYSLFLLDVMNAQGHVMSHERLPERVEEIFIAFMRLLPHHFASHHDIAFYASNLNITPTYLSRVVRLVTGRTVVDHINQMLLMEAVFLLQRSELSIEQIADRLSFAAPSGFTKFFTRMRGLPPKEFRKRSK